MQRILAFVLLALAVGLLIYGQSLLAIFLVAVALIVLMRSESD